MSFNESESLVSRDENFTDVPNETTTDPNLSYRDPVSVDVFEVIVTFVGIVGILANGFMLAIMISSKHIPNEETKVLIINQITLDLVACTCLVITYTLKIVDYIYEYFLGLLMCFFFGSESLLIGLLVNSSISLVVIALERYLKITHWLFYRQHYKKWMTKFMIVWTWLLGPLLSGLPAFAKTSRVEEGQCVPLDFWPEVWMRRLFACLTFIGTYIIPLVILIFSYWEIMKVVRRRSCNVIPGQTGSKNQGSTNEAAFKRQVHVVKTLIALVVCYAVCVTPNQLYFFLCNMLDLPMFDVPRYFCVFLTFLNVCMNPFIYAVRLEAFKVWGRRFAAALRPRPPPGGQIIEINEQHMNAIASGVNKISNAKTT